MTVGDRTQQIADSVPVFDLPAGYYNIEVVAKSSLHQPFVYPAQSSVTLEAGDSKEVTVKVHPSSRQPEKKHEAITTCYPPGSVPPTQACSDGEQLPTMIDRIPSEILAVSNQVCVMTRITNLVDLEYAVVTTTSIDRQSLISAIVLGVGKGGTIKFSQVMLKKLGIEAAKKLGKKALEELAKKLASLPIGVLISLLTPSTPATEVHETRETASGKKVKGTVIYSETAGSPY